MRGICHDGDTDQGLPGRVLDRPPDRRLLRRHGDRRQQEGKGKDATKNVLHNYMVSLVGCLQKTLKISPAFPSKIAKQPPQNI
jgi:hypothetical protein